MLGVAMARLEPPARLLRKQGSCFATLARTIVFQQLASSAAEAIFKRVLLACKARGDMLRRVDAGRASECEP